MKSWTKFYTPHVLSKLLIESVASNYEPSYVVDICAGSCNLLKAASKRWPEAKLYGSDIVKIDTNLASEVTIKTKQLDALLSHNVISHYKNKTNKIVVANPPFGCMHDKISFNIPQQLKYIYDSIKGAKRIECYITLSNIAILNNGDYFAAILPENIFSGENLKFFKYNLFQLFDSRQIRCHTSKFESSEVKTRIFTGRFKGVPKKFRAFLNMEEQDLTNSIHFNQIVRGIDNSKLNPVSNVSSMLKVVHFSNKKGNVNNYKTVKDNELSRRKIVLINDILILRVGRNAGTIIFTDERHHGYPISDLLFILRDGNKLSVNILLKLEVELCKKVKGLTSKYISKRDIVSALQTVNK